VKGLGLCNCFPKIIFERNKDVPFVFYIWFRRLIIEEDEDINEESREEKP